MTTAIINGIVQVLAEAVPKIIEIWSVKDQPHLTQAEVLSEIDRIIKGQAAAEARENAVAQAPPP